MRPIYLVSCYINKLKVKVAVSDIKATVSRTYHMLDQERSEKVLHKVYRWLEAPDASRNLAAAKSKRHGSTGSWFLKCKPFLNWQTGSRRCLWLNGPPGCGKTVLTSTIIDQILRDQDEPSFITLYFFFDFADKRKQSLDGLLQSLATQIYNKCGASRETLDTLFRECNRGNSDPSAEGLSQALDTIFKMFGRVSIILDALDECKNRSKVLQWLETVSDREDSNVSLLFTSRKEYDLEVRLQRWFHKPYEFTLRQDLVNPDICVYIQDILHTSTAFERWLSQPAVLNDIEFEMTSRAKGM